MDIYEYFNQAQNPKELYGLITDKSSWPKKENDEVDLSPDAKNYQSQFQREVDAIIQAAVKLRAENPKLSQVPSNNNLTDILNWCIDNQNEQIEEAESKEQLWNPDDLDYMENSEAVKTFTKSKMFLSTLSKLLKPNGQIRYMRKRGVGCKVHIGDFREYCLSSTKYLPDKLASEIADEILANREAEKETIKHMKDITGKG